MLQVISKHDKSCYKCCKLFQNMINAATYVESYLDFSKFSSKLLQKVPFVIIVSIFIFNQQNLLLLEHFKNILEKILF